MMRLKAGQLPLHILAGVYDVVELTDATGTRVIGHFTPVDLERRRQIVADMIARTDWEELARRAAEPGPWRLHSEIIEELKRRYPIDERVEPLPDLIIEPS